MNSYGKRLNRAEIFTALHAGDESEQTPALTFEVIAAQVAAQTSFGQIDENTVHSAVLARRGPDVHRDIRLEFSDNDRRGTIDFPGEGQEAAFREGEEALRRAVQFVQGDAGVPHFTMLAYRYLLVVLTRVFGHFPDPDPANRKLLRRWFWRTALVGPSIFRGSTTGAVRQLCGKVRPGDLTGSVQEVLETVSRSSPIFPDVRRFKTNEATAKITLCSWWELNPRDPTTGRPFDTARLADTLAEQNTVVDAVRFVFPSRFVPAEQRQWAANRILIPATERETGGTVGDLFCRPPIDAVSIDDWPAVLRSHPITRASADHLSNDRVSEFLHERQEAIVSQLEGFLRRMCEWDFEDTPPIGELVIEDLSSPEDNDDAR